MLNNIDSVPCIEHGSNSELHANSEFNVMHETPALHFLLRVCTQQNEKVLQYSNTFDDAKYLFVNSELLR
jgi:hypothetical protein